MIRFLIFVIIFLLVSKVIELLIKFIRTIVNPSKDISQTKKNKKNSYHQIEDAEFEDITDKKK